MINQKEKILLIQLLLEDIRGNWGWESSGRRDVLAMKLAMELKDKVEGMDKLVETIVDYNGEDGRYFRYPYPCGYQEMEELHGLNKKIKEKGKEFQKLAVEYLTYPEYSFEDWNEYKSN